MPLNLEPPKTMKHPPCEQKLDKARTLAIKLFEASEAEKSKHPIEVWGTHRTRKWSDLPSESVAVWDAVAICAYREILKHNDHV